MQRIIALDIGSYSIKAVEILNHFKSYEISNFYENVIPQIEELSPDMIIPNCMDQIFKENGITADRIITAMPGQYISSRIIPFNFSDPQKIQAAVYSELEDIVPFNLDEMIVDHQVLGSKAGKTNVLVVMTKTSFLSSFLEHLQRINIDPKMVDVDSLSFYNLCPHLDMEPGKVYGLVDIGHEKTSVCLVQDGVLMMFRSINLGGRYLTEFLARDLEVSFAEAERIKHKVSYVKTSEHAGSELNEEETVVADRITVAANAIVKEIGRTLYAFKNWEKAPIEKIFLSGGTSRIRNLDRYLADHLEVPTTLNRLNETDLRINEQLVGNISIMVQGIAIGIRAVTSLKRHSRINLRKDAFAYVQDYESALKGAGLAFKIVAIALILFSLSYLSKYFIYSRQTARLEALYKKEFLDAFPDMKKKYSANIPFDKLKRESLSMLSDRITSKRNSSDNFINVNGDSGALVVLKEISASLPKEVAINVVEYRYTAKPDGSGTVRLRVEADSFDTLDKFKVALKNVKVFDEVVEKSSDTKPGSDTKVAVIETNYLRS